MQNIPIQIVNCLLNISDCHMQVLFRLKKFGYNISIDWITKQRLINFIKKNRIIYNKMKYEDNCRLPLIFSIPKLEFENIVKNNTSFYGIRKELKVKYGFFVEINTVQKRIDMDNIYDLNLTHHNIQKLKDISDDDFIEIVRQSESYMEINKKLGRNPKKNYTIKNRIVQLNINVDHLKTKTHRPNKRPLEEILKKGTKYNSSDLKRRLIKEGILENKCVDCGNIGEWNGKPLTLQLDHINGDHDDNCLENLAVRCPNCHTQTDNYGSKNKAYQKDGFRDKHKLHKLEPKKEYKCLDCNAEICRDATRCDPCYRKTLRKVDRPSYEQLKTDLEEMTCVATAKKYGVTDNAIRKWLKNYEKENSIKNMSNNLTEK